MKQPATLNPKFFKATGLNDTFNGQGLTFDQYITQTRKLVEQTRIDTTPETHETIINANTPYEFIPENAQPSATGKPYKRAMLLVHGLSDSPFTLTDMGRAYAKNGMLARGILLPGHGTVPGDLLNVNNEEWEKCIQYGIDELKKVADEVYVTAFSMGATLTIQHAIHHKDVSGLILIAPALKFRTLRVPFHTNLHKIIGSIFPSFKWFPKQRQDDYAKYQTFTVNASVQTTKLMYKTHKQLEEKPLDIPIFLIMSTDDELLSPNAMFDFFKENQHPKNQMLIYGTPPKDWAIEKNIEVKNSAYPEQKILHFSHPSLFVSPDNPHYGVNGDHVDFKHYHQHVPPSSEDIYLGAPTSKALRKYVIQRLRYNPDFEGMMGRVLEFLDN